MIQPPRTYADWVRVLDMLKRHEDDAAVLSAMKAGSIVWQSGVAERFAQKLTDAINARMNEANDRFSRSMGRSRGDERSIISALLTLRREMAFLADAINLPAIPEQDRRKYVQLVREQADIMQSSLEDSARQDRTGKLSSILRNHRVNAFQENY